MMYNFASFKINTMKKTITIMAYGLMALLTGCQESEGVEEEGEKLPMSIEARINESGGASRSVEKPGKSEFSSNDAIGLFVNEQAVAKWTRNESNSWSTTPAAYWPDKTKSHNFYAFYPYVANASKSSVPMPDLTKQTGKAEDLATYDFLVATATQAYSTNSGVVSFTGNNAFHHVSSLIILKIDGSGDLSSSTINGISLTGTDIVTSSTYSFDNSSAPVSVAEGDKKNTLAVTGLNGTMSSTGLTYYFILNPNTVTRSAVDLVLDYTTGSDTYKAKKTGLGSESSHYEGGKRYDYTLKITDGVLSISGGDIADWTSGGNMEDIVINGEKQDTSEQ